jgi:sigma-B regulation protein RsbU (phosphoserine phosphatase)
MIGAFDELPFVNQGVLIVEPDTIIFNYTDGIVEFDGEEEQSLTEENLLDLLFENRDKPLKELNNFIIEKIEELRHQEEASDDITILSLKIH